MFSLEISHYQVQCLLNKSSSDGTPLSPISETSAESTDPATMFMLRASKDKKSIMDYFGEDLYQEIYEYLLEARQKDVSDKVIERQMKYFVGSTNKNALNM